MRGEMGGEGESKDGVGKDRDSDEGRGSVGCE